MAKNNITYHLQNILKSGEWNKDSVTQKIRVTASDGNVITAEWTMEQNN